MKYKLIDLPLWVSDILYLLSAIVLVPTVVIELFFEPFRWMKWRFHLAVLALCGVLGCYLLITGRANAFLLAAQAFIAVVIAVAMMKLLGLLVNKFSSRMSIFRYRYPLAIIRLRLPAFLSRKFANLSSINKRLLAVVFDTKLPASK